ncbi:DUF5008 domain-containing protein [Chitinophagaceae bacterium LB-8]|uniref:DUF5008 domain-containing protein n=1 Tax=Paraflavisolibacter caeni TaxID=2982496 RepID=A0A9X3B899_9BACT|nr:DUF5008 domain-containing protein [Paraflavisolibacter caeni]MCU7549411.1 DUF5008 domain-containing protein [Paraflavisolibacter caeni]
MTGKTKQKISLALCCFLAAVMIFSCVKKDLEPTETYPAALTQLVKFLDGAPYPATGGEGSVVTFNVNGLKGKEGQFKFLINQTEAEVVSVAENTVAVKVPVGASSGASAVLINGEYYFGPTFTVKGKVSIDPDFKTDVYVSNGSISGIISKPDDASSYIIYGSFSNYNNKATVDIPITSVAIIKNTCEYSSTFSMGKRGLGGSLSGLLPISGNYLAFGSFGSVDTMGNINNITLLTSSGALSTKTVDVINPDPVNRPEDGTALVPAFNGGTSGGITKAFNDASTGNTIVVGNFSSHVSTFYERSTKTGFQIDLVKIRQLIRMKPDGTFDSTFNFDMTKKEGLTNGNGFIYDAVQQSNGKIIIVGNFSTFNGQAVNYIARINNTDGSVDATFNAGKAGAVGGSISRITYNATTGKYLLLGSFKSFNGVPANGIVMIDGNGNVDNTFTFGSVDGGQPNFAAQLNNGKIMVAGSFSKYSTSAGNYIVRPGFMILNSNGTLAAGYNNTGLFRGTINSFIESTTSDGSPAVILVGNFDRFNNKEVADIVKVKLEN